MLCYPQLAQDSKGIQVKYVGFIGFYAELTKEKASAAHND